MKALTRTRAIGGSLVVTIPREIVKEEMLGEGVLVEVQIDRIKKSGFGLLKGVGKFTDKDREEMWGDRI